MNKVILYNDIIYTYYIFDIYSETHSKPLDLVADWGGNFNDPSICA